MTSNLALTSTAPNIFSANALTSSGTTVATAPPINGALYTQNMAIGRLWVIPSTQQVYMYVGDGQFLSLQAGGSGNQPLTWVTVGASQSMASNYGYLVFGEAAPITLTLPVTSVVGDKIVVLAVVYTAGGNPTYPGFTIAQNSGQQILSLPTQYTTIGQPGSISTILQGASLELVCVTANLTWDILNANNGNFNFT